MNKTRMRITPASARLEWRTIAISPKDPLAFAKDLQSALQELTDNDFTIVSQMPRGEALIITASRVHEASPETQPELPTHTTLRRRVVEMPAARTQGSTTEEVLYHFLERGEQKQRTFSSLIEALRAVKAHLLDVGNPAAAHQTVVPINITTVSMTRFEPLAFPMLLKMFAEDLPCPPG